MGDENLLEYLHFELVNYCVNDKKVNSARNNRRKRQKLIKNNNF